MKEKKNHLRLESGILYVIEDYHRAEDEEHFSGRVALVWEVTPLDNLDIDFIAEYLPNLEDSDDMRIHSEISARVRLSKNWYLSTGFIFDYDSEPPGATDRVDVSAFTTVGYRF